MLFLLRLFLLSFHFSTFFVTGQITEIFSTNHSSEVSWILELSNGDIYRISAGTMIKKIHKDSGKEAPDCQKIILPSRIDDILFGGNKVILFSAENTVIVDIPSCGIIIPPVIKPWKNGKFDYNFTQVSLWNDDSFHYFNLSLLGNPIIESISGLIYSIRYQYSPSLQFIQTAYSDGMFNRIQVESEFSKREIIPSSKVIDLDVVNITSDLSILKILLCNEDGTVILYDKQSSPQLKSITIDENYPCKKVTFNKEKNEVLALSSRGKISKLALSSWEMSKIFIQHPVLSIYTHAGKPKFYLMIENQLLSLAECNDSCKVCYNPSPEACLICNDGYYLSFGKCFPCNALCATCKTPLTCLLWKSNV